MGSFVSHLECSLTGETYPAREARGLSPAGGPLLVRYDLAAAGKALSRDTLDARPTDLWRWRELLPVRRTESIVSLGEIETPLIPIPMSGGANVLVKDGETTVIGGIYVRGGSTASAGLPILSKIPVLGFFFRNATELETKNELLIFVTPRILNRAAVAQNP